MKEIWAVAVDAGDAAQSLAAKAVELCAGSSCRVVLVHPCVENSWPQGVTGIYHIPLDAELIPNYEKAAKMISALARSHRPNAILFSANAFGRAVAPWVAAAMKTGITADCTEVRMGEEGRLIQKRPTFGGRRIATIQTKTEPCIVTVRSGVFPKPQTLVCDVRAEKIRLGDTESSVQLLERIINFEPFRSLAEEDVILAGGLGLGSRENFQRLAALAERIGVGVGASRGAVAAGYAPYAAQIGQTGVTVRPRIYVAFGISGQVQHLSGMSGAGSIIAINTDPNAPITKVSDYVLKEDCVKILQLLEQQMSSQGS